MNSASCPAALEPAFGRFRHGTVPSSSTASARVADQAHKWDEQHPKVRESAGQRDGAFAAMLARARRVLGTQVDAETLRGMAFVLQDRSREQLLRDLVSAQSAADAARAELLATYRRHLLDLAALPGVHALTDITGFGLAGHVLEMARGANAAVHIDMARVPLLPAVRELAGAGMVTGASGRNWAAYGHEVRLGAGLQPVDQALLSDPQTSGGLLVSCDAASVDEVLAIFHRHGFAEAAEVGSIVAADGSGVRLTVE